MEQLGSILSGRPPQREPQEVTIIKSFVYDEFKEPCNVTLRQHDILIRVPNGGLASQLQLRLPELADLCGSDKRFRIQIGTVDTA